MSERRKKRLSTALFFFLSGLISATWSSRIPDIQHKLQLNNAQLGTVLFALPLGLLSGLPVSSWLVAKYGSRIVMILGGLAFAVLLSFIGFINSGIGLMMLLYLFGFSRNLYNISANTSAIEVQQLYSKPIVSTFHGIWSVATFVAAGIGTVMIANGILPRYHFLSMAFICLISFGVSFKKFRKSTFVITPERKPFFVKPDRYLLLLGATAFCAMLCEGTMFDWSVNYFDKVVHANKSSVTAGYTSFIIAMAIGRLLGDKLVAKLGAINMLIVNGLLICTGFYLSILAPYILPCTIGFLFVGLGDSIVIPLVYSLASRSTKMKPGYAIASVTFLGYTGFLIGPLLVGLISEWLTMQWAFGVVGFISLGITFLTIAIKKYIV